MTQVWARESTPKSMAGEEKVVFRRLPERSRSSGGGKDLARMAGALGKRGEDQRSGSDAV